MIVLDRKNIVEPDISVICQPEKLTDKGCNGAPDWVIEIVSPSSRTMDYYNMKLLKYQTAGVREYWIVDYERNFVLVYDFQNGNVATYAFTDSIPVGRLPMRLANYFEMITNLPCGYDRELADSVMEVTARANKKIIDEIRKGGEAAMCNALLEIMAPEIGARVEERVEEAVEEAVEKAAKKTAMQMLKRGKLTIDEIAEDFGLAVKEVEQLAELQTV